MLQNSTLKDICQFVQHKKQIFNYLKQQHDCDTWLSQVRKKSGKKIFFKVSEKSGNFTKSQGIL